MILSDLSIRQAVTQKTLVIKPFVEENLQPSSLDLILGNSFVLFDNTNLAYLDLSQPIPEHYGRQIELNGEQSIVIHPGEFILGTTREWVKLPNNLVARLEGKSSLGRLGLLVHATAGYVDPGFEGQLTLEISNLANVPLMLYPGMKIAQLAFIQTTTEVELPYGHRKLGSHYHGQQGATASRLNQTND